MYLLLALFLFSCHSEKRTPAPTQFYPIEVVKTESYSSKATTSKFIYDANRKLAREEILLDSQPDSYKLYDYDASGRLVTVSFYNYKDVLQEQNYLTYNSSGQLDRFSHAYIDTSGNKHPHHYRDFIYEADGRISQTQDFSPSGSLQKTLSIIDENNVRIRVEERGADNAISLKSISNFDGKSHPLLATGINFMSQLRPGNELNNKLYNAAGTEIISWTKNITYNASGYPLKIVQTYSNGVIKTETYRYFSLN